MFVNLFISWWIFALRGFLAVVFGLLTLIWPHQTMSGLVVGFGVFVLADGIFGLLAGFGTLGSNERWWMALLQGVVGIILGSLTLLSLDKTALALAYFIAACVVFTGVVELVAAIHLQRVIAGEWAMISCATLSILLGILLFLFPSAGTLGLAWIIGFFALVLGILLIIVALRARGLQPEIEVAVHTYRHILEEKRRTKSRLKISTGSDAHTPPSMWQDRFRQQPHPKPGE